MDSITPPQSPTKGILKKPSTPDLYTRSRRFSTTSKKSTAFDDVARDIQTGHEVPRTPVCGTAYRAKHKWYRQEAGKALLLQRVDGMYEDVVRRVAVRAR
ncbi:hypothetical protein F5Y15DRAFT_411255 [Xylariaceae sp. FL0016]|nr:hypothetical protein F5Y15DRAFT_411255 [Xylariaceae sp. FL0016]